MAYDLSDYATVPERITEAKSQYPFGLFQSRIVELPPAFADKFLAVEARFYRTPDDPTPAIGLAWEPVPGKTNFTRDSELQNAETSAWGRALIAAFVADAKRGVASREEVRNRRGDDTEQVIDEARNWTDIAKRCPDSGHAVYDNRDENKKRVLEGKKKLPAFKCVERDCGWISWEDGFFDKGTPERIDFDPADIPVEAKDDFDALEAPF